MKPIFWLVSGFGFRGMKVYILSLQSDQDDHYIKGSVMLYKKIVIFLFLIFSTSFAIANDTERHQIIDGMSIYLGVLPTQLIKDHSALPCISE